MKSAKKSATPRSTTRRKPASNESGTSARKTSGSKPGAPSDPPKRRPTKRAAAAPQAMPPVPPLLLENDATPAPQPSGPGMRYALGPRPPSTRLEKAPVQGDLPEAYGTKRLLLTARDPHWLYAHWDLTHAQLREYNALSADRHLVVRIYRNQLGDIPDAEVHVHPESRNWFIHVGTGGTRYVAELGYYTDPARRWVRISTSSPTFTPPDDLSADTSVQFATIPPEVSFDTLAAIIRNAVADHVPLAEAILQLKAAGVQGLPEPEAFTRETWTPEQQQALASIISLDQFRRVWIGSLEITELVRRHLAHEVSSLGVADLGGQVAALGAVGSLASPYGGLEQKKGFWFNVNAELIVYGATDPTASVTIGGRPIQLRPDGSFSYRFALPDGTYQLPATANAADGQDSRTADLRFSRETLYHGHVAQHPQDPGLKPPHPDHVT